MYDAGIGDLSAALTRILLRAPWPVSVPPLLLDGMGREDQGDDKYGLQIEADNKAAGCAEAEENNVLHLGRCSDQRRGASVEKVKAGWCGGGEEASGLKCDFRQAARCLPLTVVCEEAERL